MNSLQTKIYPSLQGFGGINTGKAPFNIEDAEATDMLNVSSDDFPALSQPKAASEVMAGIDEIYYLGTLFDGVFFCIGKIGNTTGIYYYDGNEWQSVSITAQVRSLLDGSGGFTSTNFSVSKTIIGTGGSMLEVTKPSTYSVSIITPQTTQAGTEPVPENVDFVTTKAERLLTASHSTDVFGASGYQETSWVNADDIQLFHIQTEEGQYSTGLTVYNDYALYFQKNSTHILYGKTPDSYSLDVLSGSVGCIENKTIAETNVALMWLAADGVYAYSATTLPYKISEPIKKYVDNFSGEAAASSDGKKYYLSLGQADGGYVLCIYDTENKCWDVEENAGYKIFLRRENEVFASDGSTIYKLNSAEFDGDWYFVTKPFDFAGVAGKTNFHSLNISVRAKKGATLDVFISPDIDSSFFVNVHRQTFLRDYDGKIEIKNLRPDANFRNMNYFRIKLSGRKSCTVYALEIEMRNRRGTY